MKHTNNTNTGPAVSFSLRFLPAVGCAPRSAWVKSYGEKEGFECSPDKAGAFRYGSGADAMAAQTGLASLGLAVSIVADTLAN